MRIHRLAVRNCVLKNQILSEPEGHGHLPFSTCHVLVVVLPVPAWIPELLDICPKMIRNVRNDLVLSQSIPSMSPAGGLVQHRKLIAELPPNPLPL